MRTLTILTVIDIVALIAGLAIYLFIVGSQLTRVAGKLEECSELVGTIHTHTVTIEPSLEHVNRTGGVVAGALPLLYGFAEGIVVGATYEADESGDERAPARPAMGRRRSRMHEAVGYRPG